MISYIKTCFRPRLFFTIIGLAVLEKSILVI